MKLLILSDSPLFTTGYANIAREFALSLPADIDIAFGSLQHMPGLLYFDAGTRRYRHYGCNPAQKIDDAVGDFSPDLIIHIRDILAQVHRWYPASYQLRSLARGTPTWGWVPVQHLIMPWEFADTCMKEYDLTLTFTRSGIDALCNAGHVRNTIDWLMPGVSKPYSEPEGPVADVGRKDVPLVMSVGVHDSPRKMFPMLMRAYREIMASVDLDFYLHTYQVGAYDLLAHINELGVQGHWLFPFTYFKEKGIAVDELVRIYRRSSAYAGVGCYSEDTHVITPDGILNYTDLKEGQLVYTLSPSGKIEAQPIQKVWLYDYSGDMVHFNNQGIDLLVTPEHRVYYSTPKLKGKLKVRPASDFLSVHAQYQIPLRGQWDGVDLPYFDYPMEEQARNIIGNERIDLYNSVIELRGTGLGNTTITNQLGVPAACITGWVNYGVVPWGKHRLLQPKLDMGDLMELFGWYIAEGSQDSKYGITISGRNPQNLQRVFALARGLGLTASITPGLRVRFTSRPLGMLFKDCGPRARQKTIPKWCLGLSRPYLKRLYDGLMAGDGSIRGHHTTYHTTSIQLRDRFIELCLKLGWSARFVHRIIPERKLDGRILHATDDWMINVRYHRTAGTIQTGRGQVRTTPYNGKVWCVTVQNHNVFVERNGWIQVSGNSGEGLNMPLQEAAAMGKMLIFPDFPNNMEVTEGISPKLRRPVKTHTLPAQAMAWESLMDVDDLSHALAEVPSSIGDPEGGRAYYKKHSWEVTAERFVSLLKKGGFY